MVFNHSVREMEERCLVAKLNGQCLGDNESQAARVVWIREKRYVVEVSSCGWYWGWKLVDMLFVRLCMVCTVCGSLGSGACDSAELR